MGDSKIKLLALLGKARQTGSPIDMSAHLNSHFPELLRGDAVLCADLVRNFHQHTLNRGQGDTNR